MYNYKKKKGKLDKKDSWLYIYIEKQKSKRMKNRGVQNPIKKSILVLVWIRDLPMFYYSTINHELI